MGIFERQITLQLSSLLSRNTSFGSLRVFLPFKTTPTTNVTQQSDPCDPHPNQIGTSTSTPTQIIHQGSPVLNSILSLNHNIVPFLPIFKIPFTRHTHTSTTPPPGPYNCWKCEKEIKGGSEFGYLLCPSCGSPQRMIIVDGGSGSGGRPSFYELFRHPETYSVDGERLAATAKRLQKRLHPDLFAGKGKEEQELSQELSSLINKAFSTLTNPIERGRYLLQIRGVVDPIGDIEKEITSEPKFLEEVLELNERLEELDSEKDWRQFREENEIVLKQIQSELDVAFNANKIDEAKILLARMKYFDTLQGKLKELKTKLNIVE